RSHDLLLEPGRQVAIPGSIVIADHPNLVWLEVAAAGTVIVLPIVAVIMVLVVFLPMIFIVVPVFGPSGSTHEKTQENHIDERFHLVLFVSFDRFLPLA